MTSLTWLLAASGVAVTVIALIVAAQMLALRRKATDNVEHTLRTRWGSAYDRLAKRFGSRGAQRAIHEHELDANPDPGDGDPTSPSQEA